MWESNNATLSGNDISFNNTTSWYGGWYGGGIHLKSSDNATLSNNTIYSNAGGHYGSGGISLEDSNDATLIGNIVSDNTAYGFDAIGGVSVSGDGVVLIGNDIYNNTTMYDWGVGHLAGGVSVSGDGAKLIGNAVHNNDASDYGGHYDYVTGGIFISGDGATLNSNDVYRNTANGFDAIGGVSVSGDDATLNSNNIYSNDGSGVYLYHSNGVILDNNVITGNRADWGHWYLQKGSGVHVTASTAHLRHNTLAYNTGGNGSGVCVTDDIKGYGGPSVVTLTNTILVSHTVGITVADGSTATLEATLWGADAWANESDWGGSGTILTGTVNVWGDPAFVYPDAGDYHIAETSTAIDAGVNAGVTIDIDGESRPNGSSHDIGADEFSPYPALAVTKQAYPTPFWPGELLTYTLRVINTGSITLTATITDVLPDQVTLGGVRTWTTTLSAPGGVWTEQVVVTVAMDYAGPLTNVVHVTTAEGATGVYTETTPSPAPRLEVSKQADPDPVQAGEPLIYTIHVTNTGNTDLHVIVTDTLPAHVIPTGVLTWTPPIIAPGDVWMRATVVTVAMGYAGPLTNVVEITTAEGATGIYTETSQAQVTPMLAVTKQAHPDPVQAGEPLTYTLRVTNTGNVTLTAMITDVLPDRVTPGGVRAWTTTLPMTDGAWTETVVVTVEMGYAGPLTNVVRVTTEEGAMGVYTETSQAGITPMLEVTKEAKPAVVQAGERLTYTIRVTNTGNVDLHATVTDVLPEHVTTTQPLVWTSQVIPAPSDTWTQTVVVTVEMGYAGPLTNVVQVATAEGATGVYTKTSQAQVTPALNVTKEAHPDPAQAGTQLTYTICVTNTGNVTLTATITDVLPDHVTPGGARTWTMTLPALGGVWTEQVVVTVAIDYAGPLTNVVQVATAEGATGIYTETSQARKLTLTVNRVGDGSVVKNPDEEAYNYGDVVTLTAIPDLGARFVGWIGDLEGVANPDTVTMDDDKIVMATFVYLPPLTFNPNPPGGTVTVEDEDGDGFFDDGEVITITATTDDCREFIGWTEDLEGKSNPTSIVLVSDLTFEAVFVTQTHTLTVNIVSNENVTGTVTLDPPGGVYSCCTVVTLTASVTSDGEWYVFDGWHGDLATSANPAAIHMNSDKIVTATLLACPCMWSPEDVSGGTISAEPTQPPGGYEPGTVVTLTAVPDYCYQFDGWTGDLASRGTQNPVVLTVDTTLNFSANFGQIVFTDVTVDTVGEGLAVIDPANGPYTCSTTITATATPTTHWVFDRWSGATTGSDNPTCFVLDESSGTTLTAHFTQYNMFLPVVLRNE